LSASKKVSRNYTQWPFLKEEHVMIAQTCRTFAENELKPMAAKIDRERMFPEQHIRKLAQLGMMGVNVSTEYGGAGMDSLSYAIVLEELARGCTSTAVVLSANSLFTSAVEGYGNEEQKKKFLTPWYFYHPIKTIKLFIS
jgi:butyryl-CoA dehydrogenase